MTSIWDSWSKEELINIIKGQLDRIRELEMDVIALKEENDLLRAAINMPAAPDYVLSDSDGDADVSVDNIDQWRW